MWITHEPQKLKINNMIEPHGRKLVHRTTKNINDLLSISINREIVNDVENISDGIFSPLEGFLCKQDFDSVLNKGKLDNGFSWTMPIIIDVDDVTAKKIKHVGDVLLKNNSTNIAILHVEEIYVFDKKTTSEKIYGTNDIRHPGVAKILSMKEYLVGGKINYIKTQLKENRFYRKTPTETRTWFEKLCWNSVVAFQTRNPPHIAHEIMQKTALTIYDGLFINPLIGKKKIGDFTDEVIIKSYETLIEQYYPKKSCMLVTLHTDMKYAGPKEAIHHAIIRQNYGCTHIIIGRDHAGVGNYYKPFAAQEIFKEYDDLKIKPIFFPTFFYCNKCISFTNEKTCPHNLDNREQISGTKLRIMINEGSFPSKYIMRPEISKIIINSSTPFVN